MFATALAVDGHRMLVKNIKTTKLRRETSTKDRGELEGHPLVTIWMMNMEHQRLQTITFSSHFGLTGSNMGKGFSMGLLMPGFPLAMGVRFDGTISTDSWWLNFQLRSEEFQKRVGGAALLAFQKLSNGKWGGSILVSSGPLPSQRQVSLEATRNTVMSGARAANRGRRGLVDVSWQGGL